jgi:hypothetical protein
VIDNVVGVEIEGYSHEHKIMFEVFARIENLSSTYYGDLEIIYLR